MILQNYISLNRALRAATQTIAEIIDTLVYEDSGFGEGTLVGILNRQLSDIELLLPQDFDQEKLIVLGQELASCKTHNDYHTVATHTLHDLENAIDSYYLNQPVSNIDYTVLDLLHSKIITSSYQHFKSENYRDAVLNSVIAVFDFIRQRTGVDKDGSDLIGHVFSLNNPLLKISALVTESEKSEQKGFIQLINGFYQGVRNPKAHTLNLSPSKNVAAQYMVFASLLCQRIEEAEE